MIPSADPRLTRRISYLPVYRQACERWVEDETTSRSLVFLGAKVQDANHYCNHLTRWTLQMNSSRKVASTAIWERISREADAFIFAIYGALDAYTQVSAVVTGVSTDREIKFPQLARLLSEESRAPEQWDELRTWLETVYRAPWFVDLRGIRNEVNYRSVLPFPLQEPIHLKGPLDWLRTYTDVTECVETGLSHLLKIDQAS